MAENTVLHRWFDEIWNKGNLDAMDELLVPAAKLHKIDEKGSDFEDKDELKKFVRRFRTAIPDIRVDVEEVFSTGDRIAGRWTARGTHTGEGLGIPPTGKRIEVTGLSYAWLENGKVVKGWNNWDNLELMQQLGMVNLPR